MLHGDDHQTRIIQKLQDLRDKLVDYKPPKIPDIPRSNTLVRAIPLSLSMLYLLRPVLSYIYEGRGYPYITARKCAKGALLVRRRRNRKDNVNGSILQNSSFIDNT